VGKGPRILARESPTEGRVAILCDTCGRQIEPEDAHEHGNCPGDAASEPVQVHGYESAAEEQIPQ
jgi:hypothetical protein